MFLPRYLITISGKDSKVMADLVGKYRIGVLQRTVRRLDEKRGYSVDALVDSSQIQILKAKGYCVEIREDLKKSNKAGRADVGKGNRYLKSVGEGRD